MAEHRKESRVPVVVLSGYLGSGKTTLLNHLLSTPGARVGVVINDFGDVNVDAGLVSGQIDEAASIAGGCLCCLSDVDGLDDALERLTHPRLELDVVIIEASGLAEPGVLAKMVRFSGAERVRPGGVIEVVDAVEYFGTLDDGIGLPPVRFAAATLAVINKVDLLPEVDRAETLARVERRVREVNPDLHLVHAVRGRIDPALVFDAATAVDPPDQLPIAALLREAHGAHGHDDHAGHAAHAGSVSVRVADTIEPGALIDLLEDPPPSAYRIKGTVCVATGRGTGDYRAYVVHVVGRFAHVAAAPRVGPDGQAGSGLAEAGPWSELVAIGPNLATNAVEQRLREAFVPAARPSADGLRRLRHRVRLGL